MYKRQIEYVWIDWEHCNECDNLSETILFRDFFRSLTSSACAHPRRAANLRGVHFVGKTTRLIPKE